MTYGLWLDQVQVHLVAAGRAIRQAGPGDIADAPTVGAHRDACLGQLNRLVLLVTGAASPAGSSAAAPPNAVAARAGKDPMVKALLRAMPGALGTTSSSSDARPRSAVAELLRSAEQAAGVAGDILASHVDPTNGPRTPEGAAIRLGAGRPAALADLAGLAVDLVHVDEELLAWMRRSVPPYLRAGSVLHQELTVQGQRADLEQLAAIAGLSRRPGLVRQLEVAPVLASPDRARTPDTAAECAELIDDFRLWTFRRPGEVGGLHLSAATRLGLLIATAAPDPNAAGQQGWRAAVLALGDIAARPPHHRNLRVAELGHVADLLRADPAAFNRGELAGLAGRLPSLAGTLAGVTRRLVLRGALMSKHIRIDPSLRRAGVAPATGHWTTATLESPAVTALLAGLEHAADLSDQPIRSRAGRAFPPLDGVTAQPHTARLESPTEAPIRSRRR